MILSFVEHKFERKDNIFYDFMLYGTLSIFLLSNMLVTLHLVVFLLNEYFTPVWQKNIRDITHELVVAMQEADKNTTGHRRSRKGLSPGNYS